MFVKVFETGRSARSRIMSYSREASPLQSAPLGFSATLIPRGVRFLSPLFPAATEIEGKRL